MSNAELGFLLPLVDLAASLLDSEDSEDVTMGLGQADQTAPLLVMTATLTASGSLGS